MDLPHLNGRLALVAVAVGAILAVSCGGGGGGGGGETAIGFPVTVARSDGRELTFERPPSRIVSLSPGHTEILYAIGAGDQVIAVDSGSDFPAEAVAKATLDAEAPDLEEIAGLEPDLVVLMSAPQELARSLDQRALPVLSLAVPDSLSTLLDQIDLLGQITGHIEGSDSLVDSMDGRIQVIFDKVGSAAGPRVFHELDDALTTVSSSTFISELYLVLNASNIADRPEEPYPRLTLEAIIEADPEVIILAHAGASPDSVKARLGWEGISAVKNNRVYALDPDILNRPGPRVVDGLEALARLLHPDLFP